MTSIFVVKFRFALLFISLVSCTPCK